VNHSNGRASWLHIYASTFCSAKLSSLSIIPRVLHTGKITLPTPFSCSQISSGSLPKRLRSSATSLLMSTLNYCLYLHIFHFAWDNPLATHNAHQTQLILCLKKYMLNVTLSPLETSGGADRSSQPGVRAHTGYQIWYVRLGSVPSNQLSNQFSDVGVIMINIVVTSTKGRTLKLTSFGLKVK
jgi:hypothetical protein